MYGLILQKRLFAYFQDGLAVVPRRDDDDCIRAALRQTGDAIAVIRLFLLERGAFLAQHDVVIRLGIAARRKRETRADHERQSQYPKKKIFHNAPI